MSIKLLIVDDEPVVSQGLVSTIPWDQLGVEIVGVAYNGLQALEWMEKEGADVILTDIFMPEMDGLEMAEHIFNDYPGTKVVMFSGYDEFEYARKAIRLGVEDYLLKPVDIDELTKLIQKLKQTIKREKESDLIRQQDMIAKIVWHYMHDAPLSAELEQACKAAHMHYRLFVSELENYCYLADTMSGQELHSLKAEWKQRFHDRLAARSIQHVSVFGHENQLITICYDETDALPEEEALVHLCEQVAESWTYRLRFGISGTAERLDRIPELHQGAYAVLSANRGKTGTVFVVGSARAGDDRALIAWSAAAESELKEAILNRDQSKAERNVRAIFDDFLHTDATLRQVLHSCRELIAVLKTRLKETVASARIDSVRLQLPDQVDLNVYNTFEALEQLLMTDIVFLMNSLGDEHENHWVIEKIKKYIHDNYNKDIRASEAAEMHYISPNYLSVLFKQATGHSFSEYVNALRIEKAKELLEKTSRKVFVIAEEVGYNEYKYFVQVFKKHVGLTPTHYRRLKNSRDS